MWIVHTNNNGPVTNGSAELNRDMQDDEEEIRDGVTGEGQGLSEEDESRINEEMEDVNGVQGHPLMQRSQQVVGGPLVQWDRFLPHLSLKVLLAESDDSTRHVVTALLRNCGYEVTAVVDGRQAWKLLEDRTNHIDLVLTEVVLPCLSGIGLLCKIMSHKTCKNIPVIMMSTHDSMSMVYKCLSKGAVDYLLKPIRKNELKNLWQHVWRKCHNVYTPYMHKQKSSAIPAEKLSHYSSFHQSIGSGSESGVRTQKSTKSKGLGESDNNIGSNDGEEIGTIGNVGDGSDHGSGTQISCTKIAVEVDSPKPWEQLTDPRDTPCAQVIHSTLEELSNNWVPTGTTKECKRQGRDLDTRVPTFPNLQLEDPCEKVLTTKDGNTGTKFFEKHSKKDGEGTDNGLLELNGDNGEFRNQVADVMSVTNISPDPQIGSAVFGIENDLSKVSSAKDKGLYQTKQIPSLELSLKRLRDIGDAGTTAHDRNVLRHSDFSAFSRYNSTSTPNQAPTGNVGSCSPLDNSSEAAKTESLTNLHSNSNGTQPNQRSNGSSNNNDMGSTTNNAFRKLIVHCDKPAPKSAIKNMHSSSAFQPVQNGHTPAAHPLGHGKANAGIDNMVLSHSRGVNQQVRVQHHHHHYHNHHHHVHNMAQQQQLPANHDNLSLNNMAAAAPQCGSSTALSTNVKGKTGFQNINADGSGSDHGSNGQNGSSVALNPRGGKMDGENELAWKGGTNGGIGLGSRNGFDRNRFAQREAALNKFRQKRKERCFEKKVRYQSRKKLAEQRPRIRGQFVRQVGRENKDKDACS